MKLVTGAVAAATEKVWVVVVSSDTLLTTNTVYSPNNPRPFVPLVHKFSATFLRPSQNCSGFIRISGQNFRAWRQRPGGEELPHVERRWRAVLVAGVESGRWRMVGGGQRMARGCIIP